MVELNNSNIRAVNAVVALRSAFGEVKSIRAIFDTLNTEFERMKNPITGKHGICCSGTDPIKTDMVKTYCAMAVKLQLNANGAFLASQSKDSIAEMKNETYLSIVNHLAVTHYLTHDDVFEVVGQWILGYDIKLIKAAICMDEVTRNRMVYTYVAARFNYDEGYQPKVTTIDDKEIKQTALEVYLTPYFNSKEIFSRPLTDEEINKLFNIAINTTFDLDFNLMAEISKIS